MTSDDTTTETGPSTAMRSLQRLIGHWKVTGGATGTVTYERFDGDHFIVQHVQLGQDGQAIVGIEMIGHLHPFGGEPSEHVHSRFYDNAGHTFDYVYELEGDTLRIWAGEKGSPAYFEGTFSDHDRAMAGEWIFPGGGGYESTMTRVT